MLFCSHEILTCSYSDAAPSTSMGNEAHAVADEEEATEDLPPENI